MDKAGTRLQSKTALVFGEESYTYEQLDKLVDGLATALLKWNVQAGDRVAFLMPNCPEIVLCYYACFKIGAVAVPINIRFGADLVRYVVNHSGAQVLIAEPCLYGQYQQATAAQPLPAQVHLTQSLGAQGWIAHLAVEGPPPAWPDLAADHPAAIFYTSGTTGQPKGVLHTRRSLEQATINQIRQIGIDAQDSTLVMLPVCYLIGFGSQVLPFHAVGATCVLLPHFEPAQALQAMETYRTTKIYGFPGLYNELVNTPEAVHHDLRALQFCFSAGEATPVVLQERF
ncbi:AMP-binding protein [Gloeobacter morelensis MG652769]|uniref:AMP-binding protein n=1 Tax=Gloeobacter morelensis MG652769 TaxID=2781736 RepID=A0ABY3PGX2_9CYAN|nr:AMP-binding protein [Gloeobacter morelensis MG652769]